jgi:hypothetical protein
MHVLISLIGSGIGIGNHVCGGCKDGPQTPFTPNVYFRLHQMQEDMELFKQMISFSGKERCPLRNLNAGKRSGKFAEAYAIDYKQHLAENEKLMHALCRTYFQDFLCYDFKFPHACRRLLAKVLRGVSPRHIANLFDEKRGPTGDDLE